jgi:hypothetical protein
MTARHYIPEDFNLHTQRHENIMSQMVHSWKACVIFWAVSMYMRFQVLMGAATEDDSLLGYSAV